MNNAQTQTVPQPEPVPQLSVLPTPPAAGPSPAPALANDAPAAAPAPRKLTRNGKIARLPYFERDMVNRMLRNNIPHSLIVEALDAHCFRVTRRNVSNWKTRGGYQDWCAEQDRALENRLRQDNLIEHLRKQDATDLPEIGLQLAATNLSQFFLKPETQLQLATDPERLARTVSMLCRLSRHIHTLQKYRDSAAKELGHDQNPERIKRDTEKAVELTRNVYSAEKLGKSAREPNIPHRNFLPRNPDIDLNPVD